MQGLLLGIGRGIGRGLALALSLLASGPLQAAAPAPADWPWSPALIQAPLSPEGSLPRLLRDALLPYASELKALRRAQWMVLDAGQARTHHWNPAFERFAERCKSDDPACMALVLGQLRALQDALLQADTQPDSRWQAQAAPLASAVADLCTHWGSGDNFGRCGLSRQLNNAGERWLASGQDRLALHYLNRYDQERQQFLSWQDQQAGLTEAQRQSARRALPELSFWVSAQKLELGGALDAARWGWMILAGEAAKAQDAPAATRATLQAWSFLELARLSWRLGDDELAQTLSDLPETRGGPPGSCLLKVARARLAVARAFAQRQPPEEADALLAGLQQADCPHTQVVLDMAVDAFQRGDAAQPATAPALRARLEAVLADCARSGECAPYRLAQLQALHAAAWGPEAGLPALFTQRLGIYEQMEMPPEAELRLDWALGRAVLERPLPPPRPGQADAPQARALALLQAAQARPVLEARNDLTASQEVQRNLSRFDGLHRLIARAEVQQGQVLPVEHSEVLRAQTLLRRLRLQRLAQELAGEKDAQAQARFEGMRAEADGLRQRAQGLGDTVVARYLRRLADDAQSRAETVRLEALAARRLERQGERRGDWISRLQGGALASMIDARHERFTRTEGDRLAPDEAYLSWLQVPDGFVATVLLRDAEAGTPRISNHWVPFGPVQQANLKLWRELLRTGSAQPDPVGGLALRGRPLWRLPDGRFLAASEAPPQGRRVQRAEELAQALGQHLLGSLPPQALARRRLMISPDGALAQLPFETLWWQGRPLTEASEAREVRDLAYVQSLAVWEELQRRVQARPTQGPQATARLLSLAQPRYALPSATTGSGERQAASGATRAAPEPEWMAELDWPELPGTRGESDALAALYRPHRQLLGEQASRAGLAGLDRQGQLAGFQLLHFATHGYVDDERSALVLSMQQGREDAYLLDSQIAGLKLNSALVLLSACETGLGRQQSGEGVMGLPYAFMLAGNIDTLMSLWAVDDRGTAAFVPAFMARVARGEDVVAALNATKREFQQGRHGEALRDPRIWAAFVLYGVPLTLPAAGS